jgi:hypothetical protein
LPTQIEAGFKVTGAEVLLNYPTADEICGFPDSLEPAQDAMHRLRDAISAEMQHRLPQSYRVDRLATEVSFVNE